MKMGITVLMVAGLLCGLVLIPGAQGADRYTWNGPYHVTTDPNQTYGFDPAMVETTGGTFFALMAGTVSGTGGMYLFSSSDGMNWGTPVYITSGWDECDIIQGQDGYLYAALSRSGGVEIWRGDSNGTNWGFWGQVVSIGGGQQYWTGSLTQAPDGTFYCAFMDHDGSSHHVYVSSSSNASYWPSKVLVPGPGAGNYFDPNVAEIGGILYVVYNSYYNFEMWMSRSLDKGVTWSNPTQITMSASTSAHSGPSIAEGPGGTVVVVYGTGSKGLGISETFDGGLNWNESKVQSTGYTPSIMRGQDGRLWIIYAVSSGGNWEIYTTYASQYVPPLTADTYAVLESTGGIVNFTLDAGASNGGRNYLLLGSVSGYLPGTPLPGGMAVLPLNWDVFTNFVLGLANTPVFSNFLGTLNASGAVTAQLDTLGPLPPGTAGLSMHFAFCMNNPWNFASNPVMVNIVP